MTEAIFIFLLMLSAGFHLPVSDDALVDTLHDQGLRAESTAEGVYIFLPHTRFEVNEHGIGPEQYAAIQSVAQTLVMNGVRGRYLYVEGHADESGTSFYNQKLSERRADTVMKIMVEAGVSATRMIAVGYGEDHPISDVKEENRRVQLLVYTKPRKQ